MRLRELGEIRNGSVLLVHCLGKNKDGGEHCCGKIRVPFVPTIGGTPVPPPTNDGYRWNRVSGDSVDTITIEPSVDAGACGHFTVTNGELNIEKQNG